MGGGRPRASTSGRAAARTLRSASTPLSSPRPLPVIPAPPPSFLRPLPSFLRRQEPALPPPSPPIPQFIPPTPHPTHPHPQFIPPPFQESPAKCPISADPLIRLYLVDIRVHAPDPPFCRRPLPGGRLGGGWAAASVHQRPSGRPHPPERIHASVIPAPPPAIPAPPPSFLRRQEPTAPLPSSLRPLPSFLRRQEPALPPPSPPILNSFHQPPASRIPPIPNSSLPPSRGEVRWGVGGREPPPSGRAAARTLRSASTPPSSPRPLPVIPAQAGTRATSTVAPHPQFIPPPFQGGG